MLIDTFSAPNEIRNGNYIDSLKNRSYINVLITLKMYQSNPNDDADCFLNTDMVKDKPIGKFSKPIPNWELSEDDIKQIDAILLEKYNIK